MVEYTNEQTQYNVNEQDHEGTQEQFAEKLDRVWWHFYSSERIVQVISIEDTEEAHCCLCRPIKLIEKKQNKLISY